MDWQQEYDDLRREVAAYSSELAEKPHCVLFTKAGLVRRGFRSAHQAPGSFGSFTVSAAARTGLDNLLAGGGGNLGMRKATERREKRQLPDVRVDALALALARVGAEGTAERVDGFGSAPLRSLPRFSRTNGRGFVRRPCA